MAGVGMDGSCMISVLESIRVTLLGGSITPGEIGTCPVGEFAGAAGVDGITDGTSFEIDGCTVGGLTAAGTVRGKDWMAGLEMD